MKRNRSKIEGEVTATESGGDGKGSTGERRRGGSVRVGERRGGVRWRFQPPPLTSLLAVLPNVASCEGEGS